MSHLQNCSFQQSHMTRRCSPTIPRIIPHLQRPGLEKPPTTSSSPTSTMLLLLVQETPTTTYESTNYWPTTFQYDRLQFCVSSTSNKEPCCGSNDLAPIIETLKDSTSPDCPNCWRPICKTQLSRVTTKCFHNKLPRCFWKSSRQSKMEVIWANMRTAIAIFWSHSFNQSWQALLAKSVQLDQASLVAAAALASARS